MNTEQQTNAVRAKIKVTDLTGKHATLSWDSGTPFAIYNVYQYDYILKSWSLRTQVRVNTVELTDLTPAMFYKFKITVPGSDVLQESTVGETDFYTRPSASKMKLSVSGATEVTLKWSTKHSPAYYELYRAEKILSAQSFTTSSSAHSSKQTPDAPIRAFRGFAPLGIS